MNINIIGVPTFYGCDKNGPQLGPNKLRDKGVLSTLKKYNHRVFDLGNIHVDTIHESHKFESHPDMKYLKPILELNSNLAHSVNCSLSSSCFPLVIGGDHSIALGSISGVSKFFNKNFAVIWFDAHGDINTFETSISKNIHGMPLASLMGYGHKSMQNLYVEGIKVFENNVFHLGARDIDSGEREFIKNTNMNIYYPDEIYSKGMDFIIDNIINDILSNDINAI
ncbi:MAG: arginase, partial [Paraclostridium sp.]